MKYTVAVILSTALFAILGLLAAWGVAAYYPETDPAESSRTAGGSMASVARDAADYTRFRGGTITAAFIGVPLGGAIVGLLVGCTGAAIGHRFREKRSFEKDL